MKFNRANRTARRIISLLIFSLPLAFALPASAAPEGVMSSEDSKASPSSSPFSAFEIKPYIEYSVGLSIVRNQNTSGGDPPNPDFWGRIQSDAGYNVAGAIGLHLLDNFRTEIAIGYRSNEVTNLGVGARETRASGDLSLFTAMVNGYYEYNLENVGGYGITLAPYVGAGVGFGQARLDAQSEGQRVQVDDDNAAFTWNVMAGVTYPISPVTELSLGYRYLATEDIRYKGEVAGSGIRWIDSEYDSHDVTLGLRINFP